MSKFLLSNPTLLMSIVSLVVMVQSARAIEAPTNFPNRSACVPETRSNFTLTCSRTGNVVNPATPRVIDFNLAQPEAPIMLDFTEAESDAAVAKYGCDCPVCINALRQLQNLPPLVY